MKNNFKPKTRIELDPIGLYYSLKRSEKYPATYSLSVHLKKEVNPKVLQEAVNDLMKRLPFLNVCLKKDLFSYYHEILSEPPIIQKASDFPVPCSYFGKGEDHMLRVLYGKKHFTVEVMHSICDGRGLSKITTALLVHYFKLTNVTITDKTGIVNCSQTLDPEEAEDAYLRFADLKKTNPPEKFPAYHTKKPFSDNLKVVSQKFDLSKIKSASKVYDATITEYILGHIFEVLEEERIAETGFEKEKSKASKKTITAMMPIDCRSFFFSKTLRNFVISKIIAKPETNDFTNMLKHIYHEFEKINNDFVLESINEKEKIHKISHYLPLFIKKFFIKYIERYYEGDISTTFSNLGLIYLPKEIEKRVEMLEFIIGPENDAPHSFSCVAHGNILTLTINLHIKDDDIAKKLIKRLNEAIC